MPQMRGPDAVGAADAEMVSIVRNVRVAGYMVKKLREKQFLGIRSIFLQCDCGRVNIAGVSKSVLRGASIYANSISAPILQCDM